MPTKKKQAARDLTAFRCESCRAFQQKPGSCVCCGYNEVSLQQVTRARYCELFGHLDDGPILKMWNECCTTHTRYKCGRCGKTLVKKDEESYGCLFHGPLK